MILDHLYSVLNICEGSRTSCQELLQLNCRKLKFKGFSFDFIKYKFLLLFSSVIDRALSALVHFMQCILVSGLLWNFTDCFYLIVNPKTKQILPKYSEKSIEKVTRKSLHCTLRVFGVILTFPWRYLSFYAPNAENMTLIILTS